MARTRRAAAAATRSGVRRPARSRSRSASDRAPRTRRPRTVSAPRTPLLTPDQRRELCGVGGIGAGVVLAAVLALPGGGSVAAPIHDALFTWLGVGAWLAAAAPLVAGVRMLGQRGWSGGMQGAAGSLLTAVAVLGFLGLVDPGTAGRVGQRLGPGLGNRLGDAAAGTAWLVIACLGLVLAVELRVGRVATAVRAWWAEARLGDTEALVQAPADPPPPEPPAGGGRRRRAAADEALALPLFIPDGADIGLPAAEEPVPDEAPSPAIPFSREFEGLPVDPVPEPDAAALGTAEAPLHAVEVVTDEVEPERVWTVPSIELLDTVTGKRERLEAEIRSTRGPSSRPSARSASTPGCAASTAAHGDPVRAPAGGRGAGAQDRQPPDRPLPGAGARRSASRPRSPARPRWASRFPTSRRQLVTLRDILQTRPPSARCTQARDRPWHRRQRPPVVGDLARMPHLLIAGRHRQGKWCASTRCITEPPAPGHPRPSELHPDRPQAGRAERLRRLPHLLLPVVVEPRGRGGVLRWAVEEMEERYKLFAAEGGATSPPSTSARRLLELARRCPTSWWSSTSSPT